MGKNKKKSVREPLPKEPSPPLTAPENDLAPVVDEPEAVVNVPFEQERTPISPPEATNRFLRMLPDLIKAALALAVVILGAVIWYKPPLILMSHPYVSYAFGGQTATDAKLYRPLAMPTRYYIELPRELAGRYMWFAVDRRREVAALAEEPRHRFMGRKAIKRSDPLGLDLEFRKLDHSEWQVHFFDDAIVFSNAVLTVRMDAKQDNSNTGK